MQFLSIGQAKTFINNFFIVTSTVEYIITNVVVDILVETEPLEKRLPFDEVSSQYLLRVQDSCQYLSNDSQLKDYEYVHACYKMDKDVEFVLEPTKILCRPFRRTVRYDSGLIYQI